MAPFMRSLRVHAAGKEEVLPKRFVFVVKSSGIDKFNLVPEGLENHFLQSKGNIGDDAPKPGGAIQASLKDHKLPEKLSPLAALQGQVDHPAKFVGRDLSRQSHHGLRHAFLP